jgi:hypothetical protein
VSRPTLALAVSGHGFGHSVRCAEVAHELLERGARVLLRSDAPSWLYPPQVEVLPAPGDWPLDVGVAQHDGLELDVDETRRAWTCFATQFEERAEVEAHLLRQAGVDAVIGDVPPLAFAAARRAGIPSVALANFGWDWIYAAWPGFQNAVACIRSAYSAAELLLRLPLHPTSADAFPAFARIEDVPLVARHARRPRAQVRAELGVAETTTLVLVSFGGFNARGVDLTSLGAWRDCTFVLTPPLADGLRVAPANVLALNETPADYVSLLAACDVVISKPGYGIVADCLANRVALLFTDRGPFREYEVLAAALPTLGPARHIPRQDLLQGRLGPHLAALLRSSTPWTPQPMHGARVVADRVLSIANHRKRYRC